jgi:hypothetical protein
MPVSVFLSFRKFNNSDSSYTCRARLGDGVHIIMINWDPTKTSLCVVAFFLRLTQYYLVFKYMLKGIVRRYFEVCK